MKFTKKLHTEKKSPIVILQNMATVPTMHINYAGIGYLHRKCRDGTYLLVSCGHTFWEELFPVVPQ